MHSMFSILLHRVTTVTMLSSNKHNAAGPDWNAISLGSILLDNIGKI